MLAAQVAFGHFGHGQKLPGCWQHLQAAALLGAGEGSRGSSFVVPLHDAPGASGCKPGGFLFFSVWPRKEHSDQYPRSETSLCVPFVASLLRLFVPVQASGSFPVCIGLPGLKIKYPYV